MIALRYWRRGTLRRPLAEQERLHDMGWQWWFAWYPVRVGKRDWRWLETVARRGFDVGPWFRFEYRAKP